MREQIQQRSNYSSSRGRGERAGQSARRRSRRASVRGSSKRYIPAIDGLRTFAVMAVILYHMGFPFAKGGLLGVTVFFVISGYLITGLLTAEWDSSGTI
ncbi:MAG: acyltransferase, partial [Eggerthellaceae bacterium]|nr:acyltransferase [Eggerthellaceae bacterium]